MQVQASKVKVIQGALPRESLKYVNEMPNAVSYPIIAAVDLMAT